MAEQMPIVELVAMMVKIINERMQKEACGRVDRYLAASEASIEIRSRVGGKRLLKLNQARARGL